MPIPISASEVSRILPRRASVYIQAGVAQPTPLLQALQIDGTCDQTFVTAAFPGINEFAIDGLGPGSRSTVFYAARGFATGLRSGQTAHLPLHHSEIGRYLTEIACPDVLLIQTCAPDERGECSLGGGADFVPLLAARAGLVVAEVNSQLPRVSDGPSIPWSRLTHVCHTDRALPNIQEASIDGVAAVIARRVADLIEDGDCLQAGIGTLPEAVLSALGDRRRLGVHSGIVSEALARLIDSGAATGECKPAHHPKAVTAYLGGGSVAYRLAEQGRLAVRTPEFTHAVQVMAEIPRFVSLGAALEVDLFGQINAEQIDSRAISGTGGFVDFVRGARLSHGGRSVVMLPSTARGRSRITVSLPPGTPVTCARTDVDIVVTEHGVADLRHLSVAQRARRLIEIADPTFRDALAADWETGQC